MLFGEVGEYIDSPARFLAVIIPVSSILLIYGASKQVKYFIPKTIYCLLLLLTLFLIAIVISKETGISTTLKYDGAFEILFKGITKAFGIGFWLTLVGSVVLAYFNFKKIIYNTSKDSSLY
jgi:hypothetical protein